VERTKTYPRKNASIFLGGAGLRTEGIYD